MVYAEKMAFLLLLVLTQSGVDLDVESLGTGPASRAGMTLKKGFLFIQFDVLQLDVRFGRETSEQLAEIMESEGPRRRVRIAEAAVQAAEALVRVGFLRDIGLDRFIEEARKGARLAAESGFISREQFREVSRRLPGWYSSLEGRGVRRGDRMFYRIQPRSMRTVYVGIDGQIFVDQIDPGSDPGKTVLGGYFAEGSDFREELIDSLLEAES